MEQIAKILRKTHQHNIFTSKQTWECIRSVTDPIEPHQQKAVYKIICECSICYTGKPVGLYKDNKIKLCGFAIVNSVIQHHADKTKHHMEWKELKFSFKGHYIIEKKDQRNPRDQNSNPLATKI